MAKVSGPLMSLSASGKVADAVVYFGWKGIHTVRQWLKPANPQSPAQGNIRCIVGGTGRACGKVVKDAAYETKLDNAGVIPAQQTHQSYLVQYIKDNYLQGSGATLTGNYASMLAELTGHTAYTAWGAGADALGITDFSVSYDNVPTYEKGLGLYLLAKAAIAIGFTGSPYTKSLASWTGADIDKLVAHMQS